MEPEAILGELAKVSESISFSVQKTMLSGAPSCYNSPAAQLMVTHLRKLSSPRKNIYANNMLWLIQVTQLKFKLYSQEKIDCGFIH